MKLGGNEIVGLLPAGGQATRISPLPFSKEMFPVGFHSDRGKKCPKVISHYLLERMHLAGARKAFIILRNGKWDIPAYFGDGTMVGMHLAYLMMNLPYGAPFTLDQAFPYVRNAKILFGFPDILFYPDDAFASLLHHLEKSGSDVVLGLFPAHQAHKMDMVKFNADGTIIDIVIKPAETDLAYTWIVAVWNSVFTIFMHDYLFEMLKDNPFKMKSRQELFVGDVMREAILRGMTIGSVLFETGRYCDIGTPEDLERAVLSPTLK